MDKVEPTWRLWASGMGASSGEREKGAHGGWRREGKAER